MIGRRRTGSWRARQERQLPAALVTTPESPRLMLMRDDACERLAACEVIANE
jgi:Lhr-like helicase